MDSINTIGKVNAIKIENEDKNAQNQQPQVAFMNSAFGFGFANSQSQTNGSTAAFQA